MLSVRGLYLGQGLEEQGRRFVALAGRGGTLGGRDVTGNDFSYLVGRGGGAGRNLRKLHRIIATILYSTGKDISERS